MTISAFPKIFAIGTNYIHNIFDSPVEVTEKIDGSQFGFGKVKGELHIRSKGATIFPENPPEMFKLGVAHVLDIEHMLPDNYVFYGEFLNKPKHNTLQYRNIPRNYIALFAAHSLEDDYWLNYQEIKSWADGFDTGIVPLLFEGKINSAEELLAFMDKESYLGDCNAEGVVVKNYAQPFLLGGQPIPVMAGKFVSEKFKEVHRKNWTSENTSRGKWADFKEAFRTEARWQKAVQHLRDAGTLLESPRDIGSLIAEVKKDIAEEEKDAILKFLWKEFAGELLMRSVAGLPEWYKQQLLRNSFDAKDNLPEGTSSVGQDDVGEEVLQRAS